MTGESFDRKGVAKASGNFGKGVNPCLQWNGITKECGFRIGMLNFEKVDIVFNSATDRMENPGSPR